MCFLFFILLMWCIALVDFQVLTNLHSGINCTWSWYLILYIYYWLQFANILFKNTGVILEKESNYF